MNSQPSAAAQRPMPVVQGPPAIIEPAPPVRPAPPAAPAGPTLRVIATNDFHGALEPRPDATGAMRGGGATVAAAIRAAESECKLPDCATILVDGGDQFQGTPASNLAHGRPVIEMFNYLGLSAAALGNHEFDWSQDTLHAMMADAHYPILGANVRYANGREVPWIPNDTIIHRGPITVGIIGISTVETPTTTIPAYVRDLRFVDPVPVIDSIAPALRARGAQVVIVLAHAGGSCGSNECHGEIFDIANRLTAKIDLIVSGHSHTRLDAIINGIPVLEARVSGRAFDVVDLSIGPPTTLLSHSVRELYTDSLPPNADVADIVQRAVARVAPIVNRPVVTLAEPMPKEGHQYPLGNLIADAMRVVGRGDVGLMNNGGIRAPLPAGTVSYGLLFEVEPFANTLVRIRVRGADLRAFFERTLHADPDYHISGARLVYHVAPSLGVDSIAIGGRPLDDHATYTVVETNFNAAGGDNLGFGAAALSTESAGVIDLDAFIAYLRSVAQPVKAPQATRIVLRP